MNHKTRRGLILLATFGTLVIGLVLFSSLISNNRDKESERILINAEKFNHGPSRDDDSKCYRPSRASSRLSKLVKNLDSESCVETILNVACLLEKNELYPKELVSKCYTTPQISKTKREMVSIAFLIFVKHRQVRQLKRLLINIYRPEHTYFLYIDNCYNLTLIELAEELTGFKNVHIRQHRSDRCGNSDDLQLTISALKLFLIKHHHWNWDYLLKLNDDDFPIVAIDDMSRFFALTFGSNYLEFRNYSLTKTKVTVHCNGQSYTVGYSNPPMGIQIQTGPYNFALTKEFVEFWLSPTNSLSDDILKWAKRMPKPEEIFLPTLIMNSIFCQTVDNRSIFVKKFQSMNSSIQTNFDDKDFLNLLPESNLVNVKFFAENFNPMINQQIIENVESLIDTYSDYSSMIGMKNYWFTFWNSTESKLTGTEYSFVKLSKLLILDRLKRCLLINLSSFIPISLTTLRRFDNYEGILLKFQMKCRDSDIIFEAFVQSVHSQTIFPPDPGMKMEKELLNLNLISLSGIETKKYPNIFGSDDKLKLISQWVIGDENFDCSAVCLNSAGRVQGLQKMNISKADLTIDTNLKISSNLEPGLLTVQLVKNMQLIGETKTFIFPNEETNYKQYKRTFSEFNKIKRLCVTERTKANLASCQCSKPEIPICETTDWSSYSPDTKSDLARLKQR